jgi:glycosyltransferase involved in cell wall biosynthesis
VQASIVISNYNYGKFLRASIDSALEQTAPAEVIVVDDGSSDESRQIIRSYGDRVIPVLKTNGGQASALNAGFATSRGSTILFLDADDTLRSTAVERATAAISERGVSKVHWPLEVIDADGQPEGRVHPNGPLPEGEFFDALLKQGPWMCETPPTSGNAWSRRMLEEIFPIPEAEYRICSDAYLLTAAPLAGAIRCVAQPQSRYRMHDRNNYWNQPFAEALRRGIATYEMQCRTASDLLNRRGIAHDTTGWRLHSWWHRLRDAIEDIKRVVPTGEAFLLADDDLWGTPDELDGDRRRIPYPELNARYSGPPCDDAAALSELRRQRARGLSFVAFAWDSAWYLDSYPALSQWLNRHANRALCNERVTIFDMRQAP